jgi:hypothetical protein
MKERPLIFSGPMVRALLENRKTQTRRICKPAASLSQVIRHGDAWSDETGTPVFHSPYGRPGDRLWVKETTIDVEAFGWPGPLYAESQEARDAMASGYGAFDRPDYIPPSRIRKRTSLFMKRSMSRILLEIIEVRVERLQDISEADAIAEGIEQLGPGKWRNYMYTELPDGLPRHADDPVASYASLWRTINGGASWDANPWVWRVEFRRTGASSDGAVSFSCSPRPPSAPE